MSDDRPPSPDNPSREDRAFRLKEDVRRSLNTLVATFRPLRTLEAVTLSMLTLFFLYYGLRFSKLLEQLGAPAWSWQASWPFGISIGVASLHLLNQLTRLLIRVKFLRPHSRQLLAQLDEAQAELDDEPARRDFRLVRDTLASSEPILFRGTAGFVWSVALALLFLAASIVALALAR